MSNIIISYRRIDSQAIAGRIFDRLVARYGASSVFMDIDAIPIGVDYREHLEGALNRCDAVIVVVGPQWLRPQAGGEPRLFNEADPVRSEVETAILKKKIVIPVLVDHAKMPAEENLPAELKSFAYLNALEIDAGRDFETHVNRLIASLDRFVGKAHDASTASVIAQQAPRRGASAGSPTRAAVPQSRGIAQLFLTFAIIPTLALLIGHYILVMKLDTDTVYLRALTVVVGLLLGFMLWWHSGYGLKVASAFGAIVGIASVLGMLAVVGWIDGTPIFPSSLFEWQESIEYAVGIILAAVIGNAFASATSNLPFLKGRH